MSDGSSSFTLLLSTRNPGKIKELSALLTNLSLTLQSVGDLSGAPHVEEDEHTLQGNARKKADVLHAYTGLPTLADDTGLEVEILAGRPGVHSARYAGVDATDAENRALLLHELEDASHRVACFRTVLAFMDRGTLRFFEGICRGHIVRAPRGEGGFGYDALFQPEGYDQTFAEMDVDLKNRISHRRKALDGFHAYLKDRLG